MHRVTTRETLFIVCVTTRKTLFVSPSFSMSSGQDQGEQNQESTARALPEDKVLTENNGEIGYFLKKGSEFFPVTNFSVNCVGYVAETPQSGSSEGFLFKVSPKTSIVSGAQDEEPVAADPESSQQYYLTWRDMSTQQGILSKIPSKKLWTLPSKDQYLPAYFKRLCDEYVNSGNSRRLFPVECHGLQRDSFPPTWVIGSNLHVVLQDDRADRIHERVSPYAVLGDEVSPLPIVDIGEESLLDDGAGLRELILIQEKYLGDNFPATLLMLGGLGIGIHYEQLRSLYDGVPLIMAFGSPVSGKSLAVQMAMSLLNIRESIGECTPVGILKMATSQTLPFWWDDVSDFFMLEHLVIQTFNQSQRKTAREEGQVLPRTVPLVTMNPQCIHSKKKIDKERISRVFSRIAVVPFQKVTNKQTLEGCLNLRADVAPVIEKTVLSVGLMIELRSSFAAMRGDALFKEICSLMLDSCLDMRSQMNYALLLYSTGKILEKLQLKGDYFDSVKSFFLDSLVPQHMQLMDPESKGDARSDSTEYNQGEIEELMAMIVRIVQKCLDNSEEAKKFFIARTSMSKCKCGDVLGFKVDEVLKFAEEPGKEQVLRRFVSKTGRGCVGRLTFPGRKQVSGCVHLRRSLFPAPMLKSIDEAFSQTSKKAINSSQVTVEIQDENDADDTVSEKNTRALNQTSVKSTNSQVTVDIQNENDADDAILVKSTQEFESATATATSSKTGTEEDSTHLDQDDLDKLNFDKEIYERSEALRAAELRRKREFESATATATSSKTGSDEEIRDQHKAQSKRKKGSVRNEASNLVDGIHPGIMHKKLRSRK